MVSVLSSPNLCGDVGCCGAWLASARLWMMKTHVGRGRKRVDRNRWRRREDRQMPSPSRISSAGSVPRVPVILHGHGSCLHILARSVTDFRSVFMERGCRRRRLSCFGRMEHMLLVLIQTPAGGVAVTHSSLSGRGSQKILLSLESADKRDFERRIYGSF